MHVREARDEDAAAVGRLTVDAYRSAGLLDHDPEYADVLADAASRIRDATVVVIEQDGELLGAMTLAEPGSPLADVARDGELEVRMLVVRTDARRRGVAARLMIAAEDRAHRLGLPHVVLSVERRNTGAQRFYERLGFERQPDRDWTYGEHLHLLVSRKAVRKPGD